MLAPIYTFVNILDKIRKDLLVLLLHLFVFLFFFNSMIHVYEYMSLHTQM